ncbi:MAG: biotin--[acetyl-CoA-carboxylase] ligase [Bacteroidales bacterium]|nr:biotin--[acetyl-CoA-carboxylase] ligase [Bacteroidales bacterium]
MNVLMYFCAMISSLIHFQQVTRSTNRDMEEWVRANGQSDRALPELYTLAAGFQEAGRGQGSNRWCSEAGQNLLASFYFRPPLLAARQFCFNQFFTLAVRRLLLAYLPEVQVKWPNDIYVGDKKLAGILIEHAVQGEKLRYTIAGIGLNVNQQDFPSDLPNPVSLRQLLGHPLEVDELLQQLHTTLTEDYAQFKSTPPDVLQQNYLSALYRKDCYFLYNIENKIVTAKITGVDEFGRLLLLAHDGTPYCCGMKEVKYIL